MLRRSLKLCVDWSRIDKNEYLTAMRESVIDSTHIKALLKGALTDKINDREMFMKGIDYSYYYEEESAYSLIPSMRIDRQKLKQMSEELI